LRDFSTRLEGRCLRYGDGRWESAPDLEEEIGKICWDDIVLPLVTLTGIRESVEASSITATPTPPGGSPGGAASCS